MPMLKSVHPSIRSFPIIDTEFSSQTVCLCFRSGPLTGMPDDKACLNQIRTASSTSLRFDDRARFLVGARSRSSLLRSFRIVLRLDFGSPILGKYPAFSFPCLPQLTTFDGLSHSFQLGSHFVLDTTARARS